MNYQLTNYLRIKDILEDFGIKMTESAMSNPTIFQNTISNRRDEFDLLFVKIKYPSDLAVISVFKTKAVASFKSIDLVDNCYLEGSFY